MKYLLSICVVVLVSSSLFGETEVPVSEGGCPPIFELPQCLGGYYDKCFRTDGSATISNVGNTSPDSVSAGTCENCAEGSTTNFSCSVAISFTKTKTTTYSGSLAYKDTIKLALNRALGTGDGFTFTATATAAPNQIVYFSGEADYVEAREASMTSTYRCHWVPVANPVCGKPQDYAGTPQISNATGDGYVGAGKGVVKEVDPCDE
ncbi:MAG: hypothetical protein ABH873_04225 [Candidatus Firestonebacteria bacterium]